MKTMKLLATTGLLTTVLTSVGTAQTIDYATLESIFGEPVTTSATGKPQRASESPVSMEIITSEEIRRSGAKDIPQILQRVAGVEVRRSFIGKADVSIRGYIQPFSNRTLVLVNGRQLLSDGFGHVDWGMLPVEMNEIRQIEVVKGPNSSLFGFNAESGVINIITYSPLKDDVSTAEMKLGTQAHHEASVIHTLKADNKALRVAVGALQSDGFDRDGQPAGSSLEDNDNSWKRRHVGVDGEWQLDSTTNLRAEIQYLQGKYDAAIPYYAYTSAPIQKSAYSLNLKKQSDYGLWDIHAYRNSDDTTSSTIGYYNDLHVLKASNLYKLNADHTFRTGLEYRDNKISGNMFGSGTNFTSELVAPSFMWDWQVSDRVSWTNSIRYDNVSYKRNALGTLTNTINAVRTDDLTLDDYDRTIEEFSFNSGLLYRLNAEESLRFSVARGLHIPSLIEMGSSGELQSGAGFEGNPDLEAERIMSVELGYDKAFTDRNMKFTSAVFFQRMENALGTDINFITFPGPAVAPNFTFNNTGESESWGIELGFEGLYNDWLRWGANYTHIFLDDESEADTGGIFFEEGQPEHQLTVYGGFDHGKWEFDADLHYISTYRHSTTGISNLSIADTSVSGKVEDYFVLNARAGYNFAENTSIAIEGYNLIDQHREWAGEDNISLVNEPERPNSSSLGRSILVNLTHKF